jgi:hypothetical protein
MCAVGLLAKIPIVLKIRPVAPNPTNAFKPETRADLIDSNRGDAGSSFRD